jgi:Ca2+-binding EF-hand superfamily protein
VRPPLFLHEAALGRVPFTIIILCAACGASGTVPPASPTADPTLMALDTDKDGTLDWPEVKAAASAKFDVIDVNHDGTLDEKDLAAANVDKAAIEKADRDHNGTLTKDEYLGLVQDAFKAADRDNDGKISAPELQTKAGQTLRSLIQ